MALNFPQNPQQGDIYEADNGIRYEFDGVKWGGQTNPSASSSLTFIEDLFVSGQNNSVTITPNNNKLTLTVNIDGGNASSSF